MRKGAFTGFLVYLIFGIYLLNMALEFLPLPETFLKADKWIILISSVLIFIGAINYLRVINAKNYRVHKFR